MIITLYNLVYMPEEAAIWKKSSLMNVSDHQDYCCDSWNCAVEQMFIQLGHISQCIGELITLILLTHLCLNKMTTITETAQFFNWNIRISSRISLKLFLGVQLSISQHWFRSWLGTKQETSHHWNQFWPSSMMHICGTNGRWVEIHIELS